MAIKPSLSLIICSSLFASLLFFSYGTVPRKLLQVREDGYRQDKAGLRGHRSNTAPSQQNSPLDKHTKLFAFGLKIFPDKQIMDIKRSLTFVLCCSLLSSILFFSYGTISRKLLAIQEDSNGQSKAGVKGSYSKPAHSWEGRNPPPASSARKVTPGTLNANKPAVDCGSGTPYSACIPKPYSYERNCTGTYNRRCYRS
ncbi:hypothetical protein GQ457_10G028200 [Hibiscus cannabinus]